MENGNVKHAEKKLRHPDLIKRDEEIEAIELTTEETRYLLWAGKDHKWHKERNPNDSNEKEK